MGIARKPAVSPRKGNWVSRSSSRKGSKRMTMSGTSSTNYKYNYSLPSIRAIGNRNPATKPLKSGGPEQDERDQGERPGPQAGGQRRPRAQDDPRPHDRRSPEARAADHAAGVVHDRG